MIFYIKVIQDRKWLFLNYLFWGGGGWILASYRIHKSLTDKINSGTGLSYRPASHVAWRGVPIRQPYAGVNFFPSQGSMNSATVQLAGGWGNFHWRCFSVFSPAARFDGIEGHMWWRGLYYTKCRCVERLLVERTSQYTVTEGLKIINGCVSKGCVICRTMMRRGEGRMTAAKASWCRQRPQHS